ncbi:hypothetical protein BJ170DRAFT_616119 [Xylariales sp. AK1849]|nr:hypothetical protein BJ170DRAFT_616119 [Xylariales sp. AK1849]
MKRVRQSHWRGKFAAAAFTRFQCCRCARIDSRGLPFFTAVSSRYYKAATWAPLRHAIRRQSQCIRLRIAVRCLRITSTACDKIQLDFARNAMHCWRARFHGISRKPHVIILHGAAGDTVDRTDHVMISTLDNRSCSWRVIREWMNQRPLFCLCWSYVNHTGHCNLFFVSLSSWSRLGL